MNFFGHAAVARAAGDAPRFILGAMLPDFERLCGGSLRVLDDPVLEAGVTHHHRTDQVFHGLSHWQALYLGAVRTLLAAGVRRGSARAAAHLGVEMMLDATLATDAASCAAFAAGLDAAQGLLGDDAAFGDRGHRRRWQLMCERLGGGIPAGYLDDRFVSERIEGALRRRPLLCLEGSARAAVDAALPDLRRAVAASAAALLAALRDGLSPPGAAGVDHDRTVEDDTALRRE